MFKDFLKAVVKSGNNCCDMFRNIATELSIEYRLERETERVIEVRHEGKWITIREGCREWDDGKTWSRDGWPDSFNHIEEALEKIGRPRAMWYHMRSMNLVIQDETDAKIGIRSTSFAIPMLGFRKDRLEFLFNGLKAKCVYH